MSISRIPQIEGTTHILMCFNTTGEEEEDDEGQGQVGIDTTTTGTSTGPITSTGRSGEE